MSILVVQVWYIIFDYLFTYLSKRLEIHPFLISVTLLLEYTMFPPTAKIA